MYKTLELCTSEQFKLLSIFLKHACICEFATHKYYYKNIIVYFCFIIHNLFDSILGFRVDIIL